jgi:energy-coupling factor transporter ATP-binding protein EcfA2
MAENFRIIAIKPLTGCNKDYLKLLKEEEIYLLYKEYTIDDERITFNPIAPINLYDVENSDHRKIEINISAISGKNGSGKSTVIELLLLAINNLSKQRNTKNVKAELEYVDNVRVEFYFKTDFYYKIRIYDKEVSVYKFRKMLNQEQYQINEIQDKKFKLSDFFYTVTINYSHYAYNTKDYGTWLNGLFHKNDAYQTPLVLNPMRTNGDFKINTENDLVIARLFSNLLKPQKNVNFRKLTDNLTVTGLKISLDISKRTKVLYELPEIQEKATKEKPESLKVTLDDLNIDDALVFKKINKYYKFSYSSDDLKKYKLVFDYVLYKLVNISLTYDEYEKFFDRPSKSFNESLLDIYFEKLFIQDTSHITYKLKQALNYLFYKEKLLSLENQEISIDTLSKAIEDIKNDRRFKTIKRIELLPPPIFKVEFQLETASGEKVEFKTLSSGEKQLIYSVSSILYHLTNLDSVRNTRTKTAYKFINVILEEIELYFHPEMQRCFINTILQRVADMELENIRGINFCFISHSPFILSDIPQENIMFLCNKNDKAEQVKNIEFTFGANIHDLLKRGFFMNKGAIGQYAEIKIEQTITWLNEMLKLKVAGQLGIDFITKDYHRRIIEIIDEPLIKSKLIEMFLEVFPNREERVLMEIQRLGKEIGYEVLLNKKV